MMRKYILLVLSLIMIALPLYAIHLENKPRVGPIGNGPAPTPWFLVTSIVLCGIAFLGLSIIMFIKGSKGKNGTQ
ncbi:hypothetical protein FZC76_15355 [Sutcliffiella horikoshii]|uniref:DUF3955 domain-containing protein n=1 Tax=Sutcliffiella horikoshii TaxID=79883 RepID=A0A5D4SXH0_9BACI|nr:hypothetical protein [Sutcliffiella horikoshii]TYS66912.1 hypothetical protein FZC76_15355 [Sutcliffiella horikoshii]